MLEFSKFMLFSMIEVLAAMAIMLSIFRYRLVDHVWPALAVGFVMNLISFILRDELDLAMLSPIANLLILVFFVAVFVKVPLLWSFIISIVGYAVSIIVQLLVTVLSFGSLSLEVAESDPYMGYLLQTITGVLLFTLAFVLYRFGLGLAYDFVEKLRFRAERILIMSLIAIMTVSFGVLLYYKVLFIIFLTLFFAVLFFFTYTMKKELESNDTKFGSKNSFKN
jgi:hypothetical protein